MSFSFQCPVCRSVRTAAEHLFGKRVRCVDCDNFVIVDDSTLVDPQHDTVGQLLDSQSGDDLIRNSDKLDLMESASETAVISSQKDQPQTSGQVPATDDSGGGSVRSAWRAESAEGGFDGSNGNPPTETDAEEFEAFEMTKKGKRAEDEMDMTPMVDVVFLLLIFFMVTASFTLQKSMDLPTKTQDEPSPNVVVDFEDNPEYVSVFVSENNEFRVRTSEYDWEDAPNRHELNVKLRDAKEAVSKPEKMLIMAHAECMHESVVQAMDIGIEHEYKIQVIMTEESF
ncbi:biopolymer transporter ExbD [bacterium]|nr:biopolymer transporter ExbD [bacterium]